MSVLSCAKAVLCAALGLVSAATLGAAPAPPQSASPEPDGLAAQEARFDAERELDLLFETLLAERRESAHARLEIEPGPVRSPASCPAYSSDSPERSLSGKTLPAPVPARAFSRPARSPWESVAPSGATAGTIFSDYVSDPVVQARCVNCHVEGGASGFTRLVFVPSSTPGSEDANFGVIQEFLYAVEGGADLILNKVQGAAGHGGGVQIVAGSADFANVERFLRALGGETAAGGPSPQTLFDGVTMASPARTLRRAALLFAGRLPTADEYRSVASGGDASLRRAIRGLMRGPGFHDFLIRAANDRLLTDRERGNVIGSAEVKFVDLTNRRWELAQEGIAQGYANAPRRYPGYRDHERAVQYGAARAPLELVAHVVENDLPYTEILTADYIMANPMAAAAYGAATEFDDPEAVTEFRPSEIATYFRRNRSMVVEEDPPSIYRVLNPGDLATHYPHAGVLNTTVFLKRYPTTPTNRNRARSRWTYYHFLGFDIEQSAARTQDPDALADTNNPTMHNPACTVCHIPMDPVAGAFQNYGDRGMFRDKNGGQDALPPLYRRPSDGTVSPYRRGDTWFRDMREPGFAGLKAPSADNSLQWLAEQIVADDRFAAAAVRFWWPAIMGVELVDPPGDIFDPGFQAALVASAAQSLEMEALAEAFRAGFHGGSPYNARDLLAEIALSPWFRAESVTGDDPVRDAALRDAGVARLLTPEELAAKTEALTGYLWGRRMQQPFGQEEVRSRLHDPQGFSGYQLLYGGIDSDGIIDRATDMTPLMAAVAQSHAVELSCPVVRREFYFWPDGQRLLFNGVSPQDTPASAAGEAAIRAKLVELHWKFFGVEVAMSSPDVDEAFDLFVEVWDRKRSSEGPSFYDSRFQCADAGDHLYFEGLLDDAYAYNDNGQSQLRLDRVREYMRGVDHDDPQHAVRTWVATLAYLMTDYRYLYF